MNAGAPLVTDNTFEEQTATPINISFDVPTDFSNNTLLNNALTGIGLEGSTLPNANTLGTTQNLPYIIDTTVVIPEGASLTFMPGVVVKINPLFHYHYYTMNVEGTLIAEGTADTPILFTSLTDDSVAGDTNNDSFVTGPRR